MYPFSGTNRIYGEYVLGGVVRLAANVHIPLWVSFLVVDCLGWMDMITLELEFGGKVPFIE